MRSVQVSLRRSTAVELILALSILSACSDSVTPPPPVVNRGNTDADVAFCAGSEPRWVAIQDGDGAWTRVQPSIGRYVSFRHTFVAPRAAIAAARVFANGLTALSIQYGAPAELAIVGDTNPAHCGAPVSKTVLGTVAGLGAADVAVVRSGFASADLIGPSDSDGFVLRDLTSGPQEILATHFTRNGTAQTLTQIILRRDPELPDSAAIPVLDFTSPEAFAPAVAHVTITGLGDEGANGFTRLRTAHAENIISFFSGNADLPVQRFDAIPETKLAPGDLQVVGVTTNPSLGNATRSAFAYFRSPDDQSVALGAEPIAPAFSTVATTPALRMRARLAGQRDYDRLTTISLQQGSSTIVVVGMTAAYAALTGGVYDLVVPDLSGVDGFDSRWALRPGEAIFWQSSRIGGTLGLGQNAVPMNGSTSRAAVLFDSLIP